MSSLDLHMKNMKLPSSYVTITNRPATFEEKFLFPEFDPIFRSLPKHHSYCATLAKNIKNNTRFLCIDTPFGIQAIGITPTSDIKHFCYKDDEVMTWAIIDALRRKGINASRSNFETIEIDMDTNKSLDESSKSNIIKFLAASRALGHSKTFGLGMIKRDASSFAKRLENNCSAIFSRNGAKKTRKKKK